MSSKNLVYLSFIMGLLVILSVGSKSFARDQRNQADMLKQALEAASEDRQALERSYREHEAEIRRSGERDDYASREEGMQIELGDGLAGEGGELKWSSQDKRGMYPGRSSFSELNRERKEINRLKEKLRRADLAPLKEL